MPGLLIADDDRRTRARLVQLLLEEGYEVLATDSPARVIEGLMKKAAHVVILGGYIGGLAVTELLRICRGCRDDVAVIVTGDEVSLATLRRLRQEGIFYYLMKPLGDEDRDEVRQVVQCAVRRGHS